MAFRFNRIVWLAASDLPFACALTAWSQVTFRHSLVSERRIVSRVREVVLIGAGLHATRGSDVQSVHSVARHVSV